ncbi:unnamed protein product [Arctogadus glacialis]
MRNTRGLAALRGARGEETAVARRVSSSPCSTRRPRQLESPQLSSPRLMLLSGPAPPPPGTTDSTAVSLGRI